jgi:hypothetical protein
MLPEDSLPLFRPILWPVLEPDVTAVKVRYVARFVLCADSVPNSIQVITLGITEKFEE